MAMPFGHEDMMKLKKFIDFIMAHPTVLNMPELEMVKNLIESFGGKVPPGEFTMPVGGKCPFGGDGSAGGMKAEPKAAEVEEEDSESEVELDMEAEPCDAQNENAHKVFLTEAVSKKSNKKRKKHHIKEQKTETTTTTTTTKTKKKKPKKEMLSEDEECNVNDFSSELQEFLPEDPINTLQPEVIIKCESDLQEQSDEQQDNTSANDGDSDDYVISCSEEDGADDDEVSNSSPKRRCTRSAVAVKQNINKFWASKYTYTKKVRKPKPLICSGNCKFKCAEYFDRKRREDLCREYHALDKVERGIYLREWVESTVSVKVKKVLVDRAETKYTNHYYFKTSDGERRRVCLKFFQATLSIQSYTVRDAMSIVISIAEQQRLEQHMRAEALQANENTEEVNGESELNSESVQLEAAMIATTAAKQTSQIKAKPVEPLVLPPPKYKSRRVSKKRLPRPKTCDETTCRTKCTTKFKEEDRIRLCEAFWNLDFKRRKDFVLSHVETCDVDVVVAKEYRKTDRMRSFSNRYHLRNTRGESLRVCLKFFTSTLAISRHYVDDAIKNSDTVTRSYISDDRRGRFTPKRNTDEQIQLVKRHIESYATWMPNKNYKTRFLHSSLSVGKMYSEYHQMCTEQQQKCVGKSTYRQIFGSCYRLAFLRPITKLMNSKGGVYKSSNPLLSHYTGEESGGHWTQPTTTCYTTTTATCSTAITTACITPQNTNTSPSTSIAANTIQIQENVQLQSFQPPAVVMQQVVNLNINPDASFTTSGFLQSPLLSEAAFNASMTNYSNPNIDQQHLIFRML